MAHTEGPWSFQYTDESGECFVVAANLGGMVGAALPWPTEVESRDFRRVVANARLIAAAPDLLEALDDCVDRFVAAFPAAENYPPIQKARAAISKATGGK